MKFSGEKGIIISGHRGNPKECPENTLKSFKSAIEIGVDMIETDIRITSDWELVLMHDNKVETTTDGPGLIKNLTLEQVRKLNAGTKDEFLNVPTLKELLEIAAPTEGLLLNLEIKVCSTDEGKEKVAYTVDKTIEMCEEYNLDKRVMFNSFDAYVLEYIYKKYGKRFILHGYYPFDILGNVTIDPKEYLDYACFWKSGKEAEECCKYLLSNGIEPCTGSDTPEEKFFEKVKFGCSMFTENDPLSLLKLRKKL